MIKKSILFKFLPLFGLIFCLSSCNYDPDHVHDYTEQVILTEPTCTEDGSGYFLCSKGDARTQDITIPAYGHDTIKKHVEPTCEKEGYDFDYCSRCAKTVKKYNIVPALGHDYQTYKIQATCTHRGHVESYCSRCGKDEYESYFVDPLGHDYTELNRQEPTCTEDGYSDLLCSRCGKYTHKILEKLGHDYITHKGKNATCYESGYGDYVTCSRCDYTTYKYVETQGHYYNSAKYEPTCLEQGFTRHTCVFCGDYYDDNYTDPIGHDLVNHEGLEPTCDKAGYKEYDSCSRCYYSTYEEIPALGIDHTYVDTVISPTYSTRGYTNHVCSKCGASYKDNYVDYLPITSVEESGTIKKSYRDDDCYYFLVYEGTITNYVFHSFYSFRYTEQMGKLKTFPREKEEPLGMDLLSSLEEKREIYDQNLKNNLNATKVTDSNSVYKAYIMLSSCGLPSPIEKDDSSMTCLASDISDITSAYNPDNVDTTNLIENVNYYYAVVGDVSLYSQVIYDITNCTYSYCPVTIVSSNLKEEFVASNSTNLVSDAVTLNISDLNLSKPSSYTTNHPIITQNFSAYTDGNFFSINGNPLGSCEEYIPFVFSDYDNLLNSGYDYVKLTTNFVINGGGHAKAKVCFTNKELGIISNWTNDYNLTKNCMTSGYLSIKARLSLFPNGIFHFHVYNYYQFIPIAIDVRNIYITAEFFNENADDCGAYGNL